MKIDLICTECGEKFTTEYKFRNKKFCNKTCYFNHARKHKTLGRSLDESIRETRQCINCGKNFIEKINHDRKLCSNECRTQWNKDEVNTEKRIQKSKDSLVSKYGVDSYFKHNLFKDNYKKNFYSKYGETSPMHVTEFVNKLKGTLRSKHLINLIPLLSNNNLIIIDDYFSNKKGNTSQPYNFKCLKCDNIFSSTLLGSGKIPICRKCNPITKNSKLEQIIKDFLNEKCIAHIDNNRSILKGKEIDIYIPSHNIGIEINGNYFHSEIHGNKDKMYHRTKVELGNKKNIKIIQIFEDEIILKKDIVISRLSNLLNKSVKLYARNCEIKEISKKISKEFINQNHIQGDTVDLIRYGLYYKNELVSVMTFSKKRKVTGNINNHNNEYELVRFCNKQNLSITGGFSKLLKHFIKTINPSKLISYADIRWSGLNVEETVYYKNGFTHIKNTSPNYWYINTNNFLNRYHRFSFRKDKLVKEGYPIHKTEWEIMVEKKYDRIWDCGSMVFEMIIKNP
jgi:hypothetical protein